VPVCKVDVGDLDRACSSLRAVEELVVGVCVKLEAGGSRLNRQIVLPVGRVGRSGVCLHGETGLQRARRGLECEGRAHAVGLLGPVGAIRDAARAVCVRPRFASGLHALHEGAVAEARGDDRVGQAPDLFIGDGSDLIFLFRFFCFARDTNSSSMILSSRLLEDVQGAAMIEFSLRENKTCLFLPVRQMAFPGCRRCSEAQRRVLRSSSTCY